MGILLARPRNRSAVLRAATVRGELACQSDSKYRAKQGPRRWRETDRHHGGTASATGLGNHLNSQEAGGRSPLGVGALSLAQASIPQAEEENAHGEVYRAGRACVKLHAGGGWAQREATGLARGGDERPGPDRGAARHPAEPACVPRGGDAVGVAVGGVGAARRGTGGDGDPREPRAEERQAGCVRAGGAASWCGTRPG